VAERQPGAGTPGDHVDILLFGDERLEERGLVIPHHALQSGHS